MAYDEGLAQRIRDLVFDNPFFEEKKMFGGLAFMYKGKMCVGVDDETLMTRIKPELMEAELQKEFVRDMDFTGKPLKGFLYVDPEGFETDEALQYWLDLAMALVESKLT